MSKAKAIQKKIEKVGATATIEKRGEPVYDAATRINFTDSATHQMKVIIDSTSLVALGEIFGPDLIESGDLIISTHNCYPWGVPEKGDSITLMGETYDVITRRPIFYKVGEVVMWRMLMRYGKRNDSRSRGT